MLTLLYPSRCVFCDRVIEGLKDSVCSFCNEKVGLVKEPLCKKCGKSIEKPESELCEDCQKMEHEFWQGHSLYPYDAVKGSIYRLKYDNRRGYADFFGRQMARYYGRWLEENHVQAIVPVPLHARRLRKRGYNQAEIIARHLGEYLGIEVRDDIIQRVKNTKPLKLLGIAQRRDNIKKAFKLRCNDVKLKAVVIIDDIYTTGTTVDEMAAVLKQAGVVRIFFLTIAAGGQ